MNEAEVYSKTGAGSDELKSRAQGLSLRLRALLIMVDGSRTVAQLRSAAASLDAPPDFLFTLESAGLIAPRLVTPAQPLKSAGPVHGASGLTDPERFVTAQKYMIECAVDAMGFRSFFFSLKLEKCFKVADLKLLLPELSHKMLRARGDLPAREMEQRLADLLG